MGGKRGAQPGNTNNRRHGSSSNRFWEGEKLNFEAMLIGGLVEERTGLWEFERGVMSIEKGRQSLEDATNLAGALGLAAMRLAGTIRMQGLIYGDDPDFAARLADAMEKREWKSRE